jgi:hypothetical protein
MQLPFIKRYDIDGLSYNRSSRVFRFFSQLKKGNNKQPILLETQNSHTLLPV